MLDSGTLLDGKKGSITVKSRTLADPNLKPPDGTSNSVGAKVSIMSVVDRVSVHVKVLVLADIGVHCDGSGTEEAKREY